MSDASKPDVGSYLRSWGSELSARQNRVRQLIGDAHWLTDGQHKEAILRDFLSRYLPLECECSTGFVRRSNRTTHCSPEIDILLFSRRLHLPYFYEGGVSIVDPAAVIATIEVKSTFGSESLKDAASNVKSARTLTVGSTSQAPALWSGIFFYDVPESRTLESAVQTLGSGLMSCVASGEEFLLPTCVVLGQHWLAFPSFHEGSLKIRAFGSDGLAFSAAICDLLASVGPQLGGPRISGFDEWGVSGPFTQLTTYF